MEAGCQQRGIEKRLGALIPGKHIKDFFDAVIDSLVPSTPRSQQAPIFRTDGEVMIHSHN